jgi:DNA-directed RNA polymerase subunit RPC12/RpoP
MKLNVDEDFANFVKNRLKNRPLVTGDWTIIRILGHEMTLKVMGTVPDGIVQVTRETIVQIQNTMLEQKPISPFNPELRKRIIDMISFKADLGFPLAETDFTPEHRQEISELAQMLEKCETLVNRAIKAKQDMLLLRNFWRKDALKREWIQSLNECEQLKKEVDQRIIAIASSIKKYPPSFIHIDFQRFLDAMKNKGIILEKIQCPHCGGMLEVTEVPKKEEVLKCKYCGFSILAINLFEKFKEMLRP